MLRYTSFEFDEFDEFFIRSDRPNVTKKPVVFVVTVTQIGARRGNRYLVTVTKASSCQLDNLCLKSAPKCKPYHTFKKDTKAPLDSSSDRALDGRPCLRRVRPSSFRQQALSKKGAPELPTRVASF